MKTIKLSYILSSFMITIICILGWYILVGVIGILIGFIGGLAYTWTLNKDMNEEIK